MLKNLNILITGATGFIGYNLAKKLSKDNQIYCIVRDSSNIIKLQSLNNVKLITYDGGLDSLYNQISKVKIDIAYHLASLFVAEHNITQIDQLIDSNIKFSTQLVDVLIELGCLNFVNAGTIWQNYNNTKYNPVCLYAATKQAFMDILEYYNQVKGLSIVNLKIYDTYGYSDERKKLFWLFKKIANTSEIVDMPPGDQKLNLVYITDVVNAFELAGLILHDKVLQINETYGVYCQESYSLKELASKFENIARCKLNLNWGAKAYRTREVMLPNMCLPKVPNWNAIIDIDHGIKLLIKE